MVDINATLIAQILNFLVFLAILTKFAYKPLLKAMDDRRNGIFNDLDSAEQIRLEAEALKEQYAVQLSGARHEAIEIVNKANQMAQHIHDELVKKTCLEQETLLANTKERIEKDKQRILLDIRSEVIKLSTLIAEKIVNQKLNSEKDQKWIVKIANNVLDKC